MMKRLMFLVLWVFACVGAARADELTWETDYDKALEIAKTKQKPVLVDFFATWCGPCRLMETTTFANADVQEDLDDYVLVKMDFDQNAVLVGKYSVQAIPACFVLNQFGEKVASRVGYAPPEDFRAWLDDHFIEATAKVSKNQAVVDRMKNLGAALDLPDASARDGAVASLLEIYCARNTDDDGNGAKLAEQELRGFVQRHPALALNYLNDRRLAVRILFAAQFADQIGSDFSFDPWADSASRTAAATAWAKKIGP